MKNILNIGIKVTVSLILSSSMLTGCVAIFRYFDPGFTIGFLDLLAKFSLVGWMMLILTTVIVYAILAILPAKVRRQNGQVRPQRTTREQAD